VPASFTFPHTGKLLSLSFILFAGWFAGSSLPVTEYPRLAGVGLLASFGSVNMSIPFLLDVSGSRSIRSSCSWRPASSTRDSGP
jgi:hypothetical protein